MLDSAERAFFDLRFENRFLKARGEAFQDFFSEVMERRYPGDFVRVRPWGAQGDRKNDGYCRSIRHLFQVYAPNEMRERAAIKKIDEDFFGAMPYWRDYFDTWVFVHNSHEGLGPKIVKRLLDLDQHCAEISCSAWGLPELRTQVFMLSPENLASLFGPAPSREAARDIQFDELNLVISRLAQKEPLGDVDLRPVPEDKLEFNDLSADVLELLRLGMTKSDLVVQLFTKWHDPELGDRIAAAFNAEYLELRNRNMGPDQIFSGLWEMARNGLPRESRNETAVLAVLAHLFEACDIFERPINNLGVLP